MNENKRHLILYNLIFDLAIDYKKKERPLIVAKNRILFPEVEHNKESAKLIKQMRKYSGRIPNNIDENKIPASVAIAFVNDVFGCFDGIIAEKNNILCDDLTEGIEIIEKNQFTI